MILFRPEHVAPILAGEKTQTRRTGKRRWNVESVHACYTKPPFAKGGAEPFCEVRVKRVRQELLRDISDSDCVAEGYADREAFADVWDRIYGEDAWQRDGKTPVWVVTFELGRCP